MSNKAADHFSPEDSEARWQALAVKAQKGDRQAYNQLLNALTPYIKSRLIPTLSNADWAEDITQDILISVHKSFKTYSPKRPFRPWLNAIINFRRTDYLRKYYKQRDNHKTSLENPEFYKNYVTDPVHAGEYIDIEKALAGLPAEQSDVFRKIKIEGQSAKDVAKEMDMSVSAVKVSAHRTMKKLQELLK